MARVFLHIGYPKTATTSLQWFFTRNADKLRHSANVLYPRTGRTQAAHYGLSMSLNVGVYDGKERTSGAAKELLDKEINESGCDTILISSEAFIAAKSFEPILAFFSGHTVHFVVYLRRHDHAFESAYSQSVCLTVDPPWNPGIESFVLYQIGTSTVPWDYLRTLRRLSAGVGKDNVIVRPFERAQNSPDIYADFLAAIDVKDAVAYERPSGERNPSLPYRTLATIDAIMRSKVSPEMKQNYVEALIRLRGSAQNERSLLSPNTRNAILAKYRADYAEIAREFLGRADGILFKEPPPSANSDWCPPSSPTIQESADLILRAAASIKQLEQAPPVMTLADVAPIAEEYRRSRNAT